jgi:hypothetical protein
MAVSTVTASGRDTRLQVRNGCMTEAAIAIMRYINRSVFSSTRIMTITTWAHTEGHISGSYMVDTAMNRQFLVRMASQAIGGIGPKSYCINHLLSRTVMTGGAGTGTVGGNIMFGSLNFRPVRHNMTAGAERARRIIGKVTGTYCHCMCMSGMDGLPGGAMAGGAVAALCKCLTVCIRD